MKKWVLIAVAVLLTTFIISAQTVPPVNVSTSSTISAAANTITFRVKWNSAPNVDSTVLAVFVSSDSLPILMRRATSPDTIVLPTPDDTTTYRFVLYSMRRGVASTPADAKFEFDAHKYYRLVKFYIWPGDTTLNVGETLQMCPFFELNDGSVLIRERDRDKPTCIQAYNKLPQEVRRPHGARQRLVDQMCLEWQVQGKAPVQEECGTPQLVQKVTSLSRNGY
jgi:hypothetical protein